MPWNGEKYLLQRNFEKNNERGQILTLTKLNTLQNGNVSIANYYRPKKELFSRSNTEFTALCSNLAPRLGTC